MRNYLGNIIDIPLVCFSLFLRNDLHIPCPRWEVRSFNSVEKILSSIINVISSNFSCFLYWKIFNTLISLEVIFHKEDFTLVVDPLVGVRGVTIHVSETIRDTSVTEQNGNLVERFRTQTPEIPSHIWVSNVVVRVLLLTVNEVREFDWVPDEENRSVISYHVIISFLCIEFNGESSWISDGIRRSLLSCNSRESDEKRCPLSKSLKELSFAVSITYYRVKITLKHHGLLRNIHELLHLLHGQLSLEFFLCQIWPAYQ